MKTKRAILYLYCETPLHVGTGTGLGAVDMPIQREKHTNYPVIQASGVKGALRDTAEISLGLHDQDETKRKQAEKLVKSIFGGASGDQGDDHAGAMSPSDARILCFPVRALNGVFLWITSPTVLNRYVRETEADAPVEVPTGTDALVSDSARLLNGKIMLEEFTYTAKEDSAAQAWAKLLADRIFENDDYWRERFCSHFVILSDDEFRDFVRYSTEVVTRIHLDDTTKIVKVGQLFTQELLPADSVLYSFLQVTDSRAKDSTMEASDILTKLKDKIGKHIQIGANETVGRGRIHLSWQEVD